MRLRKTIALLLLLTLALTLVPGVSFAAPPEGPCEGRDAARNGGNHFWSVVDKKDATCTKEGYVTYRCTYCNQKYKETIPALGHKWGNAVVVKAPTCTQEGTEKVVCKRDSSHVRNQTIPALGHDWSEWERVKEPTLTEEGIEERKCQRCGLTERRFIPMLGQKETYSLSLVMTQTSPGGDTFAYEELFGEGGIGLAYSVTLINTGTAPLNVTDYVGGTGKAGTVSTVVLYPGESSTFTLPETIAPEDIPGGTASETLYGATTFSYYFFGDNFDGEEHVCVSNTASFSYKIKSPEGFETWQIPSESAVKVVKALVHGPADPNGFQLGETVYYTLEVENVSSVAIPELTLFDARYGAHEEALLTMDLEPGEKRTWTYDHTVDEDDVVRGFITNHAVARWTDWESGEALEQTSNAVTVAVLNKAALVLMKTVASAPGNGQYYLPGEEVHFQVTVLNNSATNQKAIMVVDPLTGETKVCQDMVPGASDTLDFFYTVTEPDAVLGYVDNYAYAMEVENAISNTVRVPAGFDAPPFGILTTLEITKTEVSTYTNGHGYELGDTIAYDVTVKNVGETMIVEGTVHDSLLPGSGEIGAFDNLYPDTSRTFHVSHVVNEMDIHAKKVVNQAFAWFDGEMVASNLVESPTWGEDPYGFEGDDPLLGADDCCRRTLTGKGTATDAFTVHFCGEHQKQAEELEKLKATVSEGEYLKAARTAWQEAMDALYEAAREKANSELAAALMNQRLSFLEYMDTYEALLTSLYPDAPLTVARELLRETQNKCVDLCYELHEAPKARVDSVLSAGVETLPAAAPAETCTRLEGEREGAELQYTETLCAEHAAIAERITALYRSATNRDGRTNAFLRAQHMWQTIMDGRTNARYKAADKDGRVLIAKNRLAFDKYVAARRALLTALYPAQPDTVAQVIARVFQDKEMDLCLLWK